MLREMSEPAKFRAGSSLADGKNLVVFGTFFGVIAAPIDTASALPALPGAKSGKPTAFQQMARLMNHQQLMHAAGLHPVRISGQKVQTFQRRVNAFFITDKPHVLGHDLTHAGFKHCLGDAVFPLFQRPENPLELRVDPAFQPRQADGFTPFAGC